MKEALVEESSQPLTVATNVDNDVKEDDKAKSVTVKYAERQTQTAQDGEHPDFNYQNKATVEKLLNKLENETHVIFSCSYPNVKILIIARMGVRFWCTLASRIWKRCSVGYRKIIPAYVNWANIKRGQHVRLYQRDSY